MTSVRAGFGRPDYNRETGLVRYYPALDGGRRRRAWIEQHVVPLYDQARTANPLIRDGALTVVQYSKGWNTRVETLALHLVLSAGGGSQPSSSHALAETQHAWVGAELTAMFACCCPDATADARPTTVARLGPHPEYGPDEVGVELLAAGELPRPWLDGIRDIGTDAIHSFSPDDADRRRTLFLKNKLEPLVRARFADHPQLRSVAVAVAQYFTDEALDEVSMQLIFSELETPDLSAYDVWDGDDTDPVNLPTLGRRPQPFCFTGNRIISLFAPFCSENGNLVEHGYEQFSPYAVMRRAGDDVLTEIVGVLYRPWLEGRMSIDAFSSRSESRPDPFDETDDAWLDVRPDLDSDPRTWW